MQNHKINYRKFLNQIKSLTDNEIRNIKKDYTTCLYEAAITVLLYYDKALHSLVSTQCALEKDESNYYSQAILFRSIIEHFFKALMVFFTIKENGTKYAEIFLNDYAKYEFKGYIEKCKPFIEETKYKKLINIIEQVPLTDDPKKQIKFLNIPIY